MRSPLCANLGEAWRKRRYEKAFISKLSDAEAEAAETQVWIEFAVRFGYLGRDEANTLFLSYDAILRTIVGMINHPETWVIGDSHKQAEKAPSALSAQGFGVGSWGLGAAMRERPASSPNKVA